VPYPESTRGLTAWLKKRPYLLVFNPGNDKEYAEVRGERVKLRVITPFYAPARFVRWLPADGDILIDTPVASPMNLVRVRGEVVNASDHSAYQRLRIAGLGHDIAYSEAGFSICLERFDYFDPDKEAPVPGDILALPGVRVPIDRYAAFLTGSPGVFSVTVGGVDTEVPVVRNPKYDADGVRAWRMAWPLAGFGVLW
jgi:hypothetical protein